MQSRKVTRQNTSVFDLSMLNEISLSEPVKDFQWCTPYHAYSFLSYGLVQEITSAVNDYGFTERLSAVVWSKLYDVVVDLAHVTRISVDLCFMHESGKHPLYNIERSPITHFLKTNESDVDTVLQHRIWHYIPRKGNLSAIKRALLREQSFWKMRLKRPAHRIDLISHNTLVDEFLDKEPVNCLHCSPNYYDWSDGKKSSQSTAHAAEVIFEAYKKQISKNLHQAQDITPSLFNLAWRFIQFHLSKAWEDLKYIESRIRGRNVGKILASGTPKSIGRLIAWHYRRNGAQVYRFAHGGERAFYDDYPWALAELPFCDRYYCHSQMEAEAISQRYKEGRTAQVVLSKIKYLSMGSEKHQRIRAHSKENDRILPSGIIMYIAGGYLGESFGDFPSRKPPDPLYLDWQLWLLYTLRDLGYQVVTKVHPKGIMSDAALLGGVSQIIEKDYFDPQEYAVDCYLYDFCGTAFFDSLASNKGIVILDMKARVFDKYTVNHLKKRCQIVECYQNENNLFRTDASLLDAAVKQATEQRDWPESLFELYFH